MPRRDGTGPMGTGAMTGRGVGYCNPAMNATLDNQPIYFGGYGFGRGNRRQFCVVGTPGYLRNNYLQNSVEMDEKTLLENQLMQIKDRLSIQI